MPVPAALAADPEIAGPLGGLALSAVRVASPMLAMRALAWHRGLARMGLALPFVLVHDVGLLFAAPREYVALGARAALGAIDARSRRVEVAARAYHEVVREIFESDASERAATMRLVDDVITALLARLLTPFARAGGAHAEPRVPFDPELLRDLDAELVGLFAGAPREDDLATLEGIARERLSLLALVDALDMDTLRFFSGPGAPAPGALAHVDLLSALQNPATSDVVLFSLELLPRILDTRRRSAAGTVAEEGYAGFAASGSIDSLVGTELAWDDDELGRRIAEREVLYYARERSPEEARRVHIVAIDASASMRGEREVFARGLALALAKKLELAGEDVSVRFFDARLYEARRYQAGALAAYVLGFRGERGRNPARVFAQLTTELALARARDSREPVVHLLTHAALHVPRVLVEEARRIARLSAVFILPSEGALDLEYLDLLDAHAVVDQATLLDRRARTDAATRIVGDTAKRAEALRRAGA